MIRLFPRVICLLFLTLTLGLAAQQQAHSGGTSRVASGSIANAAPGGFEVGGIVVHAISGEPLPGALVMLSLLDRSNPTQTTTTDANGRFLLKGVAAGKYRLSAKRLGFPQQAFEAHGSLFGAVAVGPNKESQNLVFRLKPEGSVSGRIMNDQGEAVRDGRVMLFLWHIEGGERTISAYKNTLTADDGSYRFGHLPAGKYFVAVSAQPWYAQHAAQAASAPSDATTAAPNGSEVDVAYPITYYGDAIEPEAATPISLNWGAHAAADINVRAVPAVHLRLANENPGSSLGIMGVTLKQSLIGGNETLVDGQTVSTGTNRLEISGLAPGRYDIGVEIPREGHGESNSIPRHQMVNVSGNLEVDAAAGSQFVTITGTVVFEGQGIPQEATLQLHSRESGQDLKIPVGAMGEIESLDVSPGHYDCSLLNAPGLVLRSISAMHGKVSGLTLEINGPDDVQLRMLASKGSGRVEGVVLRDNKPAAAALVLLVPPDPVNNRPLFRGDLSATDGTFSFAAVPPGKYTVLAIQNGSDIEWTNSAVMQPFIAHGQTVQVEQNGKTNTTIQAQ